MGGQVQFQEQIWLDSVLIVLLTDLLMSDMAFNRTTCASKDRALSAQWLILAKMAAQIADPDYVSTTFRGMKGSGVSLGEVGGAEEWKPIISCL